MSDVRISIGGTPVTFTRSPSLVAIKRRPGATTEGTGLAALTVESPSLTGQRLAGFELRAVDAEARDAHEVLESLKQSNAIAEGTEVFYTSSDQVPFVPTGEIYVEFKPGTTNAAIHTLLDAEHLTIEEARPNNTFILRATTRSRPVLDIVATLQTECNVAVAEPDLATFGALKSFVLPADDLIGEQWHLRNNGFHRNTEVGFLQGADARVIDAWTHLEMLGRPDVTVAVIDDGFDLGHPDLGGQQKIVAPFDFRRGTSDPRPDPESEDWHGTACAGVAIGSVNGRMIVGAAPACRLMPVRWGRNLSDAEIESWFDWVRERGAWVVSCSWGAAANVFPLSTRARAAIRRCAVEGRGGKGTVICFAAGNANHDIDNLPHSLDGFATHPDVIAVAACTSRDQRSHYSNFGKAIWICAPSSGSGGWGITTSDVTGTITVNGQTRELGYDSGPITNEFGGTSSACPLVAGVCALILSANPSLTATEVKNILRATARKIGGSSEYTDGHSRNFGFGCVNALEAVKAARV